MKYCFVPFDPSRYCANLRRDNETGNLIWESAAGMEALMVQTPFGVSVEAVGEELCAALSDIELPAQQYREVLPDIWARYITAGEKIRDKGCPVLREAHTYTVMTCFDEGGQRCVCRPAPNATFDIPLDFPVMVRQCTSSRGFLRRQEPNGFFSITFSQPLTEGFPDGDLVYQVSRFEVPITGAMIKQGTVFVQTEIRPEIVSKNPGLRLIKK